MSARLKVFVCTRGKKCPKRDSEDVLEAFECAAEKDGLGDTVSIKGAKCLDLCKKGPAVVVMPDKVRYGRVQPSDAAEILKAHCQGGKPVERLVIKKKKG